MITVTGKIKFILKKSCNFLISRFFSNVMVIYYGSIYVVLLKAIIPTYSLLSSSYLRSATFYISFAAGKEISDSSIL
jgi:hypothetical protein